MRVRLPGSTTWSLGMCKNQVAPRSYLVECNGTLYRRNRKHIRKKNASTSLGQYAIGWGDSNIDRQEVDERESCEPSGAMLDRQDVSNASAEPSSSVSHSPPKSSFGRVLKPTRRYIEKAVVI